MTYCTSIGRPLLKKIEAGKSLDEIGAELCGSSVKNPRQKVIRLIKELLGEETLIKHAETLKFNMNMASLGKKEKSPHAPLRKIEAEMDTEHEQEPVQEEVPCTFTVMDAVRELAKYFSIAEIKLAIATIEREKGKCETTVPK